MHETSAMDLASYLKTLPDCRRLELRGPSSAMLNHVALPGGLPDALAKAAGQVPVGMSILKFGSRSIVGSFTADGEPWVLKYYQPASFAKHLTYGILGSRCHRSWLAGLAFAHIGVPTPAPLMVAEWKSSGGLWLKRSFLATRHAAGISLAKFLDQSSPDDPRRLKVAAGLKDAFGKMARHRAIHGDLKENNIIISPDGGISFIDLDGARFLLPEDRWKKLRRKDRDRFFKNWKETPEVAGLFRHVFDSP